MLNRILIVISLVVLVSCASVPTGKPFTRIEPISEDVATVYVFRKSAFPGSLRNTNIFVDGKPVLTLSNGSYGVIELPAGEYRFGAKNVPGWQYVEGHMIEIDEGLELGKEYYLMFTKQFDVSKGMEEGVFLSNTEKEISTGVLEGGLLDSTDVIGFVVEKFGLEELSKTTKTGLVVDVDKI